MRIVRIRLLGTVEVEVDGATVPLDRVSAGWC
jgi:hypothetical protein